MAKKSSNNKTAHVLGLLTSAPDASPAADEAELPEPEINTVSQKTERRPRAAIAIENQGADPVSDVVRENLELQYSSEQSATAGAEMLESSKGMNKEMSDELLTKDLDGNDLDQEDYVTVNLVEDIVKSRAREFMKKIGGCDCFRCINDVIAITLNSLPPKYTVTHKGMLFAKISSYENQYSADISAALTKSCLMVAASPRH